MAFRLEVQIEDKSVRRWFRTAVRNSANTTPVWRRVGLFVIREAQRRLRARNAANAYGGTSGRLRASLSQGFPRADRRGVTVGSNLPYSTVQQIGTSYLPGGVIKPKNKSGLLWQPLVPHLRRNNIWPRDYAGTLFRITSKAGNQLLIDAETGEPVYLGHEELKLEVGKNVEPYIVFGKAEERFTRELITRHLGMRWRP